MWLRSLQTQVARPPRPAPGPSAAATGGIDSEDRIPGRVTDSGEDDRDAARRLLERAVSERSAATLRRERVRCRGRWRLSARPTVSPGAGTVPPSGAGHVVIHPICTSVCRAPQGARAPGDLVALTGAVTAIATVPVGLAGGGEAGPRRPSCGARAPRKYVVEERSRPGSRRISLFRCGGNNNYSS